MRFPRLLGAPPPSMTQPGGPRTLSEAVVALGCPPSAGGPEGYGYYKGSGLWRKRRWGDRFHPKQRKFQGWWRQGGWVEAQPGLPQTQAKRGPSKAPTALGPLHGAPDNHVNCHSQGGWEAGVIGLAAL